MSDILVLGPVRVVTGAGQAVAPPSDLQRTLVAVLAARRDRVVSVDELIEALWGDRLPARPGPALQSQVFRLRRLLADPSCVATDGAGYRLRLSSGRLDAGRFEELVADARRHHNDPERAVGVYDDALALWRGRAYEEVADHDPVRSEAARLEDLRVAAAEERATLLLAAGRPDDAAASMEDLIARQPFREEPVAIRMRALAAAGRHAEAVRVFATFRSALGDELGLEPSPELGALEADILRHETRRRPTIGLPGNSFVGRELDLAAVISALSSGRLVTLTGTGGVGKTRLALHAAARVADQHPDGVCLVELADVDTGNAVVVAAATALGLYDAPGVERVVEFLRTRRALLVLDNCEHVLDGARVLASAVLTRTPEIKVLATARTRLGVDGEQVVPVAPLSVPEWVDVDAPAVVLFVDRAAAVRPGFAPGERGTATIAELCRRLSGIPLAIELAAARTITRTPAEILTDVAEHADRLADRHRSNPRHRSLAAVLEWSYSLLGPIEQQVLAYITVFAGGFTAEAATAVTNDLTAEAVHDALTELVEHSLLSTVDANGAIRFTILEPIREYAESRLADTGQLEEARRDHAAWCARWIQGADAGLRSPDEATFARAIAEELPNLRAAHRWALSHDISVAAQIAAASYWYAFWYGAAEACDWALEVIERAPPPHPATARAHATAALGAWRRGESERARGLAVRGIELAGDDPDARFAWEALSSTAVVIGDYDDALACHATARDLAMRAGDITQAAREAAARAVTLGYLNRPDHAQAELDVARTLARRAANPTIDAFCEYVAGELELESTPHDALPRLVRARDAARALGNRYLAAIAGTSAVSCATRIGEPSAVLTDYAELLDYFERTGSVTQQWTLVRSLIETLTHLEQQYAAAELLGALDASTTAAPLIGSDADRIRHLRAALRRHLGKETYDEAIARGAALGDELALATARQRTTGARDHRPPTQ